MSGPWIAGVDEAGRGPLAGPVVVAAVVLDPARGIEGLNDSKVLSETKREALFDLIVARARDHAIVCIDVDVIDRINIFQATMLGMARAIEKLKQRPDSAMFDGKHVPKALTVPGRAIVNGDALEPAISAASILAKVTRDRLMREYCTRWPGYGFSVHKGYGTPEHMAALERLGPCPLHRRSFAPVRKAFLRELFAPGFWDTQEP